MATNTYHTNTYYRVRSVVRFLFWGLILSALAVGCGTLSNAINDNGKPACDVTVNRDFTWKWNGTPVDLTTCNHPYQMVLESDGTWEWFDPNL